MSDFLEEYQKRIKIIEFMDDLHKLMNCQNNSEYTQSFSIFREKHYPATSFLETFLQIIRVTKDKINRESLLTFFFYFVENRLFFVEKDFAEFHLCYELVHVKMLLEEDNILTSAEILDIIHQLAQHSDQEKWQYDALFNAYYWNQPREKDHELVTKLQTFLNNKEWNRMFFSNATPLNHLSETKEFPVIAQQEQIKFHISPGIHPEIWKSWSKYNAKISDFVRFSSPFSADTNHLDGAGLFYLVASVDPSIFLSPIYKICPYFSLLNKKLSITLSMNFIHEGPYHVHLGIGCQEKDPKGNPTGMSSWWMNKTNIYSKEVTEKEIFFSDHVDDWLYMGRNQYSFPYFKYKYLPINYALENAHSMFIAVMQGPQTKVIEGSFDIFAVTLQWKKDS